MELGVHRTGSEHGQRCVNQGEGGLARTHVHTWEPVRLTKPCVRSTDSLDDTAALLDDALVITEINTQRPRGQEQRETQGRRSSVRPGGCPLPTR